MYVLLSVTGAYYRNAADAGVVDDATVKMMKTPRCGVSDDVVVRRTKRYATSRMYCYNNIICTFALSLMMITFGNVSLGSTLQLSVCNMVHYCRNTCLNTTRYAGNAAQHTLDCAVMLSANNNLLSPLHHRYALLYDARHKMSVKTVKTASVVVPL